MITSQGKKKYIGPGVIIKSGLLTTKDITKHITNGVRVVFVQS